MNSINSAKDLDLKKIIANLKRKNRSRNWRRIKFGNVFLAMGLPLFLYLMLHLFSTPATAKVNPPEKPVELGAFEIIIPTLKYGFALDTFQIQEGVIEHNQFLADLLLPHRVDYLAIDKIARDNKAVFDVRNLRVGKTYTILSRDTAVGADYFIYEPSVYRYFVFDLRSDHRIREVERPIETRVEHAAGVVNSSLWVTMTQNGYSPDLTARMEDALAWSIDFHHIQKGDRFKLVYERNYIDGQAVGVGKIHAAHYQNLGKDYYAIRYENERHDGFYDLEARPMERAFLKAPVKYSRISSRYNLRRYHPVLKTMRPHFGTDYAAPRGTPIYAVADGVVTKASRTRGNGNYVKIKHDKVYQTQYLHMQRHAKGIRPGVHVKQGEVIGYVGSTGLATGPHVCFRFWKNGRQVNHLRENLPPPEPMPEAEIPAFEKIRDTLKATLDAIVYPESSRTTEEQKEIPKGDVPEEENPPATKEDAVSDTDPVRESSRAVAG